jgi:hypothetical protein
VEFVFVWTNPYSWTVIVDVGSAVALNGFCKAGADATFLGINSISVRVATYLIPSLPFGPVEDIYPPAQPGTGVLAGEVEAGGEGFLGLGEVRNLSVAGYYGMYYQSFLVPGGGVAVFRVGAHFQADAANGDCSAEVDFLRGDFLVMCPMVDLTMLAP